MSSRHEIKENMQFAGLDALLGLEDEKMQRLRKEI